MEKELELQGEGFVATSGEWEEAVDNLMRLFVMLDTEEQEGNLYKALFAHFKFFRFKEKRHEWYHEWAAFELMRQKLILVDLYKFKASDYESWWNILEGLYPCSAH